MEDWKVRLAEEYRELKNRLTNLRAENSKRRVEFETNADQDEFMRSRIDRATERLTHLENSLLEQQEHAMYRYLTILEDRMTLAGIPLDKAD